MIKVFEKSFRSVLISVLKIKPVSNWKLSHHKNALNVIPGYSSNKDFTLLFQRLSISPLSLALQKKPSKKAEARHMKGNADKHVTHSLLVFHLVLGFFL